MATNFEKFDKMVDIEGLKEDIIAAKENGTGDFKEVPHGNYEVSIEKLELVASKKGDPMVSVWFNIVDGPFKKSKIFMNQVITLGFQIHIINEFLRSLDSGIDVEFVNFTQYGNLILDIHEAIDGKLEYELEYTEGKKGFNNYKIVNIFEM